MDKKPQPVGFENIVHGVRELRRVSITSISSVPGTRRDSRVKEEVSGDFDEMLKKVGSWGRFQYMLTILFFPFNLFMGYVYLSSILVNYAPPHWCKIPELANLTVEERMHLSIPKGYVIEGDPESGAVYSQCEMYAPPVNWSELLEQGMLEPDQSWSRQACDNGWEFDTDNYHKSIASDFGWVCTHSWIPYTSQAIFFVGAIVGCLIFGWMSDNYGRLPASIMANLMAFVSGMCQPFVTSYQTYFILRFMMGTSYNALFTLPYILTLEYVDESKRTFIGNLGLALFLTISGVIQPWILKAVGDWRIFSWIIFSQISLIIVVPFVMPESGRWLVATGKIDKAVKILRKIAKINKKTVSDETFNEFHAASLQKWKEANSGDKRSGTLIDLFRTPRMRKNMLLVIVLWMLISLVFDSTVRNVTNLNFSIYISFMISTGLELPADLLTIPGLEYLGRRFSAALAMGLSGIFMLLSIPLMEIGSVWGVGALSMLARFWATYAMNTGFQFTVEVMPTELRSQGSALANIMSMVSQIASPYIVESSSYTPTAPFFIIGVCALIGAVPGLFLPEPQGMFLPNTLDEAEEFGRNDRFFWMPIFGDKDRFKNKEKKFEKVDKNGCANSGFSQHI